MTLWLLLAWLFEHFLHCIGYTTKKNYGKNYILKLRIPIYLIGNCQLDLMDRLNSDRSRKKRVFLWSESAVSCGTHHLTSRTWYAWYKAHISSTNVQSKQKNNDKQFLFLVQCLSNLIRGMFTVRRMHFVDKNIVLNMQNVLACGL